MRLIRKIDQFFKNLFKVIPIIWQEGNVLFRDHLTNLYNRRFLLEFGIKALAMAKRNGQPLSVVLIDLDNFKKLNDTQGHCKGDEILRKLSFTLIMNCREGDIIGRWGGDEFVIILFQADRGVAEKVIQRIEKELSEYNISISFGIKTWADYSLARNVSLIDTLWFLITQADHNMYLNKHNKIQ